jgi:formylglycine-generating enzyme required for sulfatase activity
MPKTDRRSHKESEEQKASFEAQTDSGAIAQGNGAQAVGAGGVLIGGNAERSNFIVGNNNQVVIYQGKEAVIPSAEAVARHRVALKERLEKDARSRWGGMSFYIQEEGVTLPIQASPYQVGQLGARTNLQDSLKSVQRILVLGDPGSGKTIALERLAWELCKDNEPVVPVLIRLFHYDGGPLAEWVRAHLQECDCLRLDDEQTLTAFLQEGAVRCVFLFDGLNEVVPEYRNQLVGQLDRWMSAYPRHAVIITSRVQDELWRKFREELPAVVVQPIQAEQARTYLSAHLGTKGDELYRCLDERLLGLARTPLILWLIKEAGMAGESLPGNRGELYARFVSRMLRRDTERQMDVHFSERVKQEALAALALHMSRAQRLACPRDEVVQVIASTLGKDGSEELDKAESLVAACARHGLLAGEDELWFAPHQTVQEHFAAVALREFVHQEQRMNNAARLWRNALHTMTGRRTGLDVLASEEWWMETLVQLAGITDDPTWLARTLAQTNPWLAWWCVQEGRTVDETTRTWIENRSTILLNAPELNDRRRAVQTLVQTHNERVLRPLLRAAADDDQEVSRLALQGLSDMGEAARTLVKDILPGKDELLWEAALRYLRIFPNDQLWAEIPEHMWDKILTATDRRVAVTAMLREKSERFARPLLKAAAGYDQEISHLALQGLLDMGEAVVRTVIVELLHDKDERVWKMTLHYLSVETESALWSDIARRIRTDRDLLGEARKRLLEPPLAIWEKYDKAAILAKIRACNILECGQLAKEETYYWKPPYGEPEWVTIPAGEFWMGGKGLYDGKPIHKLALPEYQIARVPVTNAQYVLYVQDVKAKPPEHWRGGSVPSGLENHPVVDVSWKEALAYCNWLSEKIEKQVCLPSEAEWEKAARGDKDKRLYPWGPWRYLHCNSSGLGLDNTTPVGLFLSGASPYGLLDMSGNVMEWTRTIWADKFGYPYQIEDGRENLQVRSPHVIRGGSFHDGEDSVRCAYRGWSPGYGDSRGGFRVMVVSTGTLSRT